MAKETPTTETPTENNIAETPQEFFTTLNETLRGKERKASAEPTIYLGLNKDVITKEQLAKIGIKRDKDFKLNTDGISFLTQNFGTTNRALILKRVVTYLLWCKAKGYMA